MPANHVAVSILSVVLLLAAAVGCEQAKRRPVDLITQPYRLDTGLVSRSISFENPTGEPGDFRG